MDRWSKLWDWAVAEDTVALIRPGENENEVGLEWPDGSATGLFWDGEDWRPREALCTCPCDVAARDAF